MRKDFYDKENLNGRETIFEPFGDGGRSKVIVKDLPGWGTNHRCETCGEVRSSTLELEGSSNFEGKLISEFLKMTSFKLRVVLCRKKTDPTLISQMKLIPLRTTLEFRSKNSVK